MEEVKNDEYTYKGVIYSIQNLVIKEKNNSLSDREKAALKSFNKKQLKESAICNGYFGVTCNRTVIYAAGLCDSCYRKQQHLKDYKLFISEVYGIKDMDRSYLNILNFPKSECTKCKTKKRSIAFPFCTTCLSTEYGLEIKLSLIPGAGLGLFAIKDLRVKEYLKLEYAGEILTKEQYHILAEKAKLDVRAARRLDYVMQFQDKFIDASGEQGGPLRFINEAPSDKLKNSKWTYKNEKVTVQTIGAIKKGCEFFLNYSDETLKFSLPSNMTAEALDQLLEITEQKRLGLGNKRLKR